MADSEYTEVFNKINDMIKNKTLTPEGINELEQFKKNYFYNNWRMRYRRLASFTPLGTRGVVAIPNTTFEEWLVWFKELFSAFIDDYNDFKKLVLEAFQLQEKHLELHDTQIAELQNKVDDIYNKIDTINNRLDKVEQDIKDLQQQIDSLNKNLFNVQYTSTVAGTLTNSWYMKENDPKEKAFGFMWGWNNTEDHSQGIHWVPLLNYIYKDNATFDSVLANDSVVGSFTMPQEILDAGFTIGETWIYSGYVVQTASLVATPFLHLVPVGNNTLEIRILNTTRSGALPENLGTVQINTGGVPTQYLA